MGPFSYLVITLLVTILFSAILLFLADQLSQVRIGPQLISKGIAAPAPAKSARRATALPPPVAMPSGPDAFAK